MDSDNAGENSPKLLGSSAENSITLKADDLGAPGTRNGITVVAQFESAAASDAEKISDRSARPFLVSGLLKRHSDYFEHIQGDFDHKDGSSFLVAKSNFTFNIATETHNFLLET